MFVKLKRQQSEIFPNSRPVIPERIIDLRQDLCRVVLHGRASHGKLSELLNESTVLIHDSPDLVLRGEDGSQGFSYLKL